MILSRNARAGVCVFNYSAPTDDPNDIDAPLLANPASWIGSEYLRRQAWKKPSSAYIAPLTGARAGWD